MGSTPASAYTVKVKAVDPSGNPEEYATCRVFGSDSIHPVAAGVTDTLGIWTGSIAKAGTYRLQLEVIGSAVAVKNFTISDAAPSRSRDNDLRHQRAFGSRGYGSAPHNHQGNRPHRL